jgi:hypothetical protein
MRIKYEIYSTLLKEVKELADKVSENLQNITGGKEKVSFGYKIGEVTVTLPEGSTKNKVKDKLEKFMNDKVPEQKIWLKEVKL